MSETRHQFITRWLHFNFNLSGNLSYLNEMSETDINWLQHLMDCDDPWSWILIHVYLLHLCMKCDPRSLTLMHAYCMYDAHIYDPGPWTTERTNERDNSRIRIYLRKESDIYYYKYKYKSDLSEERVWHLVGAFFWSIWVKSGMCQVNADECILQQLQIQGDDDDDPI